MDEIHLVQIDSIPCHIPTTPKYYLLRNLFWFMVFKGPFLGFNVIIHNTTRTTALSVASLGGSHPVQSSSFANGRSLLQYARKKT